MGGGSVALGAKALGFGEVLANDLAARSAIVGRALIENSSRRLTDEVRNNREWLLETLRYPLPAR